MTDDDFLADLLLRWEDGGRTASAADLCADRPHLLPRATAQMALLGRADWLVSPEQGVGDTSPPADTAPPAGLLAGRYRLDGPVGRGGFGEVWRGYDTKLRRPVAVKLPRPGRPTGDEDAFLAEARRVAELNCPGVVPVYDADRDADGRPYIVSELIDGQDLGRRLRVGPVPVRDAARIVCNAARALFHAHSRGFIHRDVKPANLLLDRAGRVFVADFGTALTQDELDGRGEDGAGTLGYMSPERLFGDPGRIDGRADVYSLGVVLYELLTGRPPFVADSPAGVREAILAREPAPPRAANPGVPREVERICLKCLAKSPANRYPTADALADDLARWLGRGWLGRSTRRRVALLAAVSLLVLITGWLAAGRDLLTRPMPGDEARVVDPPWPAELDAGEVRLFADPGPAGLVFNLKDAGLRMENGTVLLGHDQFYRVLTAKKFGDFVLRMEYRYRPGGKVSGAGGSVLLRVGEPGRMAQHQLRVRLAVPVEGTVRLGADPNDDLVAGKDKGVPPADGRWNRLEVRCVGRRVTAVLNGRPTGETDAAPEAAGAIGLSSQRSDIEFRDVRVRPLP